MAPASNVLRIAGTFFCLMLLLAPSLQSLHPVPSAEGPQVHSLGMAALQRWLLRDGLYADTEIQDRFLVRDQMIAIMGLLRHAALRPDARADLHNQALQLWERVQQAYDPLDLFYHSVIPAPNVAVCINLEGEAWALLATRGLLKADVGNASRLQRRIADGRTTMLNLLEQGVHRGRTICGSEVQQLPMAAIALLEARAGEPDARLETAVAAVINELVAQMRQGGLPNEGFYNVELNAKLLWMFTDAAQALPQNGNARAGRDAVASFLLNRTLSPVANGLRVYNVRQEGNALVQDREGKPLNQLWLAWTLNHYAFVRGGGLPSGALAGIMNVLLEDFWSQGRGAFVTPQELISFLPHGLAALVSDGLTLHSVTAERAELAVAVPAIRSYSFAANDRALLDNQWHLRFQLAATAGGPVDVVLTGSDLGGYNFSASKELKLFRSPAGGTRTPVPTGVLAGPVQALRFGAELTPAPTAYRLEGATPIRPVATLFDNQIQILLENPLSSPFLLRSLRLEISATDISVRAVKLNGQVVPEARLEFVTPVTTQEVQEPHSRLIVSDLSFQPGQSEVTIEYNDRSRPQIDSFALSRDADGRQILRADPTGSALQGERLYMRAVVRDNALLRNVLLRYQSQDDPREIVETPMVEGDNNVFTAVVPKVNVTGTLRLQVVAIDAATNLNQTTPIFVEVKNPLLSGSRILFAFSGTLFLTALIIWAKVRRKTA